MTDDEKTYACPDCLDSGYQPPSRKRFPSISGKGYVSGPGTWFCDCPMAERMEAGYWFRQVYPEGSRGRHQDPQGESRLKEYLYVHPMKRQWLNNAIEALRKQYESERKRATEAREER